jgi:hypothetical protein
MAKATLEFDLTDSDDMMEFERAVKATDMALVLWELVFNTKKKVFNDIEFDKIESPYDAIDKLYERLYEDLNDHGLNMDKLLR